MSRWAAILSLLIILGVPCGAGATDCQKAQRLYQASLTQRGAKVWSLLRQALRLCPNHAAALNNLGMLNERAGRPAQARQLYRRALRANPSMAAPHAGLGDIAFSAGRFKIAANHYRRFLKALPAGPGVRGLGGLVRRKSEYQAKLRRAQLKASIHGDSMRTVVGSGRLVSGLHAKKAYRGVGGAPVRERLALSIHFSANSAVISPMGRRQLDQMALALKSTSLAGHSVLIEGHADTVGELSKSLSLSIRRARAVRNYLVARGVSAARLRVVGLGSVRPIVRGKDPARQAPNRRVEFVDVTGRR